MCMDQHKFEWDRPDKIASVYFRGATTGMLKKGAGEKREYLNRLKMLWISEEKPEIFNFYVKNLENVKKEELPERY